MHKLRVLLFWVAWPAFWVISLLQARTRVFVTSGDKVLVVKNTVSTGKWSLPGGGLHRGEEPKAGALRELAEETGLRLNPGRLSHLSTNRNRELGLHYLCYYFAIELTDLPKLRRQRWEILEVAWVQPGHLNPSNATSDLLDLLNLCDGRVG